MDEIQVKNSLSSGLSSMRIANPDVRDTCIIYVHGNRWDGVPARQRYLMEEMAQFCDVVYLHDYEYKKWQITSSSVTPNITVIDGLMPMWLRFNRRNWISWSKIWSWWHLRDLRQRYKTVVLWDAENWLRSYRFIKSDIYIYDCIDPCFSDQLVDHQEFDVREKEVVSAADIVFASAELLKESCEQWSNNVILLNNACSEKEYAEELLTASKKPSWWPKTSSPIVSYLGSLDWRFDFDAVENACKDMSDVFFILAGNILSEFSDRVDKLRSFPNVICPGRISVEEGRYLLSNCNVGLIPFKPGKMNDAINPVKMYAYALLGKAMAGTGIRELLNRPGIVHTSKSENYGVAIKLALASSFSDEHASTLKKFASSNTWNDRARQAWDKIQMYKLDKQQIASGV